MFLKNLKLTLITLLFFTMSAHAARVTQAKNNKVMIDLEGESASPQQNVILMNAQNKKVAIGQILQVKNGKAVATITKGKSAGNETVRLAGGAASNGSQDVVAGRSTDQGHAFVRKDARRISGVLNFMNNSMAVLVNDGANPPINETVAMAGTTFGLTGIIDWPLYKKLSFRGTLGYEPFKATGTARRRSCANISSTECSADITYISGGGYARYDFYQSQLLFWGALGADAKFPMAKSTTALSPDDIQLTTTFGLATGIDYFIDHKFFVPASLEYQMFMKSATVDANIIMVRIGFGMAL